MALNARHRAFVKHYLKHKNAARAAREAGYAPKSTNVTGSQLLANPNIRAAVDEGLEKLAKKADVTAEMVIARLKEIAMQPLNKTDLKIRSGNALKATELLGKHLKLFTDVHELSGKDGAPIAFVALPPNGSESPDYPSPANPVPLPDDEFESG